MTSNNNQIDRHGCIDIRLESFENVWFDRSKDGAEIEGCSMNCLLHALFIANGYWKNEFTVLPGGIACWDVIMESVYITLPTIISVLEFTSRVHLLFEEYMLLRKLITSDIAVTERYYLVSNLLYGSLVFIYTWVANFNAYIEDNALMQLRSSLLLLGRGGLPHIGLDISPEVEKQLPCLQPTSVQEIPHGKGLKSSAFALMDPKTQGRYCDYCGPLYRRLEVLLDNVTYERSRYTEGFKTPLSRTPFYDNTLHLRKYNPKSVYSFIQDEHIPCFRQGHYEYLYHNRSHIFHREMLSRPSIDVLRATWQGTDTLKRKEIKKAMASGPKVEVGIFGGASSLMNFLDEESDDDEEENEQQEDKIVNQKEAIDVQPPRIKVGISLLKSPRISESENSKQAAQLRCGGLWTFEPLEIARQLTAIDHALFCSIPLYSILHIRWSDPRYLMHSQSIRKFIDRFNALSLWATVSILNENDLEERVDRYTSLVDLTHHLVTLRNYNAAMAIASALQQGCITRLKQTLVLVPLKTKESLAEIQRRLAPSRNYVHYKHELEAHLMNVPISGWKHRTDGVDACLHQMAHDDDFNNVVIDGLEPPEGVVPHLGVHLAELTQINEGNISHIAEAPHLLNIRKLVLLSRSLTFIGRLQRMTYKRLQPVRMLATLLNHSLKAYLRLNNKESASTGRMLYERSLAIESEESHATRRVSIASSNQGQGQGESLHSQEDSTTSNNNDDDSEEEDADRRSDRSDLI